MVVVGLVGDEINFAEEPASWINIHIRGGGTFVARKVQTSAHDASVFEPCCKGLRRGCWRNFNARKTAILVLSA